METTTWMYFAEEEETLHKCEFLTKMDVKFRERAKSHMQQVRESIKMLGDNQQDSIRKLGKEYKYIETPADEEFINKTLEKIAGLRSAARKGIAKALELSLARDLPIDSHRIYGSDQIRVVVCASHQRIILLFLMPGKPPKDK